MGSLQGCVMNGSITEEGPSREDEDGKSLLDFLGLLWFTRFE